jgi:hypothetical protein
MNSQKVIEKQYNVISEKLKNNEALTYNEQQFYFETTKKEHRTNIILLPKMSDFAFLMFYNIYLTDVNEEIEKMSKTHSNEKPIRETYGIQLNKIEVVDYLKTHYVKFKNDILENDNLYKENNTLKNLIKGEFKEVINKLKIEKNEIEKKTFNEVLRAKRIYLYFNNLNIDSQKIKLENLEFDLKLDFYIHITFRHYFHILQETNCYFSKDHFKTIYPQEWKEIIVKLCNAFNNKKNSLENTSKIDFIIDNTYYRIVFNIKKRNFTSLFPLNKCEINKVNINNLVVI